MDFRLPELGEGVYEAELVEWKVRVGDVVRPAQTLAEVLTDKAVMDLPAPFAGVVTGLSAEPGSTVKVGDVILRYDPSAAPDEAGKPAILTTPASEPGRVVAAAAPLATSPPTRSPQTASAPTAGQDGPTCASRIPASPSVRRMAQRLGIDLATVHGSGPGGRILIDDITPHVRPGNGLPQTARSEAGTRPAPHPEWGTAGTRIKFHGMRRRIAERMVHSARTIPHYAYVDECDVTDLVRLRESLRETFAKSGVRLTYLAFVVRAVVAALKQIPIVNSSLDEQAGEIVLRDAYHIGIATATPRGLVVPVVRNADRLTIEETAREIERLSGEARSGQIRPEDLGGGTFTITSIGGIGGLIATPVINHPETAIMAIGRVVKRPVFDAAGQVRPADMAYLSFSFDHRVIDGAVGAEFGNAVIRRLSNPATLLLADRGE